MDNIVDTISGLDNQLKETTAIVEKLRSDREAVMAASPLEQVPNIVRKFYPHCDWLSIEDVAALKSKEHVGKIICFGTDFKIGFLVDGEPKRNNFDSRWHHYSIAFDFRAFQTGVYPIESQTRGWRGEEAADGVGGIAAVCKKAGVKVLVAHDHNFNWCGSCISQAILPTKLVDPYEFETLRPIRDELHKLIPRNYSERASQKYFLGLELVKRATTNEDCENHIETFERMLLLDGKSKNWKLRVPIPADRPRQPSYEDSPNERNREAAHERFEFEQSMRGENY